MKNIQKHYIIATSIVAGSLVLSPFTTWGINSLIANELAAKILGTSQNGQNPVTEAKGKEISQSQEIPFHFKGNKDAEIYLVEYSDLECPFCKSFHSTMESIISKNEGKIAWVYKHYPLPFHPEATPAAIASECIAKLSGENGNTNFWKFTDGVFSGEIVLGKDSYLAAAQKLGIKANDFNSCLQSADIKNIIESNTNEASSLGVSGTPNTFVVKNENGKMVILESISGALPEAAVQATIDKYIK